MHKAQGSEFPAVVITLLTSHYMMLQRNLLYTAVTRAQKLVVLVGSPRAISIAVNNNRAKERYSGLAERLRGAGLQLHDGVYPRANAVARSARSNSRRGRA